MLLKGLACLIGLPCGLCKQVLEPGLAWFVGATLRQGNPALGWFFIAGAVASAIKTLFETIIQTRRDTTAGDLRIQMELDARRRAKRGY